MKTLLLLTILVAAVYFHQASPTVSTERNAVAQAASDRVGAREIVVAPAPSYSDRWKTGQKAFTDLKTGPSPCTDLKTGPNAQVTFEPFAPNSQADWNQTSGYIVTARPYRPRR